MERGVARGQQREFAAAFAAEPGNIYWYVQIGMHYRRVVVHEIMVFGFCWQAGVAVQ
jgi:hypothetical protein